MTGAFNILDDSDQGARLDCKAQMARPCGNENVKRAIRRIAFANGSKRFWTIPAGDARSTSSTAMPLVASPVTC